MNPWIPKQTFSIIILFLMMVAGGWGLYKECNLGKVTIDKPGVYSIALSADAESNWQGIQLFDIKFKPIKGKN